jgi:hypothetical protein
MKHIHIVALVAALLALAACDGVGFIETIEGNGNVITEEREVEPFTRIQFNAQGRVLVQPGSETTLSIEGESNIVDNITTRVNDDALIIENETNAPMFPNEPLTITITTPELTGAVLGGAGQLNIEDVTAELFRARIAGAGQMTIGNISSQTLEVDMAGAGAFTVNAGELDTLDVFITGLGSVDTTAIPAADVEIGLGGAGEARVWAMDTLDVTISGAGSASYYGSPQVTEQITGIGDVTSLGEK